MNEEQNGALSCQGRVPFVFKEQITPVIPVWVIWCCIRKPEALGVIVISAAGDRVRGDWGSCSPLPSCLSSRQSGQKQQEPYLHLSFSLQGCWSWNVDSHKLKTPQYKSLVMRAQLCPPALEELLKSSICGRIPWSQSWVPDLTMAHELFRRVWSEIHVREIYVSNFLTQRGVLEVSPAVTLITVSFYKW